MERRNVEKLFYRLIVFAERNFAELYYMAQALGAEGIAELTPESFLGVAKEYLSDGDAVETAKILMELAEEGKFTVAKHVLFGTAKEAYEEELALT